jgi:hypothetical protein
VSEAESLEVLKTLTEQGFQDAFKNGRSTGNVKYLWKGTTLRVIAASSPKLFFDQMAAPVPDIMEISGIHFVLCRRQLNYSVCFIHLGSSKAQNSLW